jgi:hypothetical protein
MSWKIALLGETRQLFMGETPKTLRVRQLFMGETPKTTLAHHTGSPHCLPKTAFSAAIRPYKTLYVEALRKSYGCWTWKKGAKIKNRQPISDCRLPIPNTQYPITNTPYLVLTRYISLHIRPMAAQVIEGLIF